MTKSKMLASFVVLTTAAVAGVASAVAQPVVTEQIIPEYPAKAERLEIEGAVQLAFDVQENGKVENVRVVESDRPELFDDAAVEAISQWEFQKGARDENVNVTIEFEF